MESELFYKVCGAAVLLAVLLTVLGELSGRLRVSTRLAGSVVLYGGVFAILLPLFARLSDFTARYSIASYAELLLRAVGIALLSELVAGLCRDAGENGLSSLVEMAGKGIILYLTLPTVEELLHAVGELLGDGV